MNKKFRFKKDQVVKLWDGFTDSYHHGILLDASPGKVMIRWNGRTLKDYKPTDPDWLDIKVDQRFTRLLKD